MIHRSDIVSTAKSFVGVKWRHQGRNRSTGVDCVGLVYAVADELGMIPEEGLIIPAYRTRPDETLLSYFDQYMAPVPLGQIKDGTVAIFAYRGSPWHAGIVTSYRNKGIVHAYASKKKVTSDYLDSRSKERRLVAAYDYRGILDG